VEPYLLSHPYAIEDQERMVPGCGIAGPLLLPLLFNFNFFLKRWGLTSNVIPTMTSEPDSSPRPTYALIFCRLYTSILTFLEAVVPNLQRHPHNNIRFGFHYSPYSDFDFFPPLYLNFNFS